jgi:c-di-GMP-binding flagellar brake protein YcgR
MSEQVRESVEIGDAIRTFVERRRKRRVQVGVSIIVKGLDRFGNRYEESTRSVNFSAGGTCFFLKQRIRVGTTVALAIALPPDLKTYMTTGQVTRVEAGQGQSAYKYGIRFTHKKNRGER